MEISSAALGFIALYVILNSSWKNKVKRAEKLQRKLMEI